MHWLWKSLRRYVFCKHEFQHYTELHGDVRFYAHHIDWCPKCGLKKWVK